MCRKLQSNNVCCKQEVASFLTQSQEFHPNSAAIFVLMFSHLKALLNALDSLLSIVDLAFDIIDN